MTDDGLVKVKYNGPYLVNLDQIGINIFLFRSDSNPKGFFVLLVTNIHFFLYIS